MTAEYTENIAKCPRYNTETGALLTDIDDPLPAGTNVIGTVDLAEGAEVALVTGTAVDLAEGAEVALVTGTAVGITSQYPNGATTFNLSEASTANTELTVTLAASEGKKHYLLGYQVVVSGAATGGVVDVVFSDGATAKLTDAIASGAAIGSKINLVSYIPVIAGTTNTALNIVADAAGTDSIITVSAWGYTV